MAEPERDPAILKFIRSALGRDSGRATDAELIGLYIERGDSNAFELLVWRHSATLLRTCKAVLRDHHAAEDAVQAVFLTLARKAKFIRNRESIFGWLHRTAYNVSLNLAKKAARGVKTADLSDVAASGIQGSGAELDFVIHQEIAALPEKYRLPILLCCFEGLSHADAAKRLGWPVGTVDTRISRAKNLLQKNLTRRGMTLPAVGLGALLTENTFGSVRPEFIEATIDAALAYASGSAVVGVSAQVISTARSLTRGLAQQVLVPMFAAVVGLTLAAGGIWAFARSSTDGPKDSAVESVQPIEPAFVQSKPNAEVPVPRKEIDPKVFEQFKKLGARQARYRETDFNISIDPKQPFDSIPITSFTWFSLPNGALPELPAVNAPYGLDLSGLKVNDSGIANLKTAGDFLTNLNLGKTRVSDEGMKIVGGLKGLRALSLSCTDLSDKGLAELSRLHDLEILDLGCTKITDEGLRYLLKLKKLRTLNLRQTSIGDDGLAILAKNHSIQRLFLNGARISRDGIDRLAELPNLRALYLSYVSINDDDLTAFAAFKQLRYLDLSGDSVTNKGIAALAGCAKLEGLCLRRTNVTGECLRLLSGLHLKDLSLAWTKFSTLEAKYLSLHTDLETLDLNGLPIDDAALFNLASLTKLGTLLLENTLVSDRGVESILKHDRLQVLTLSGTLVTDAGIAKLSELTELRLLGLADTKLTDEGMKSLTELKRLTDLRLENTAITDASLTVLQDFKDLRKFNLQGTKLTRSGVKQFQQSAVGRGLDAQR